MPGIVGVKETCLYVEDVARARDFYRTLFGFEVLAEDSRFVAFAVAGDHVLLIFKRGSTDRPLKLPGGEIPPHDGNGAIHLGLGIERAELEMWRAQLVEHGIEIESTVKWERGGESLYFRDPDGNLLELLTRGVWRVY